MLVFPVEYRPKVETVPFDTAVAPFDAGSVVLPFKGRHPTVSFEARFAALSELVFLDRNECPGCQFLGGQAV
ncbi:MAG TPA: hypothetical protein VMM54_13430 [Nitrospirota bacterium]|nr:hypothetical protein [Nitrospirota bacterium]